MDNLTHTLVGLTLARTPLGRAGRGTTATLLIASNAPDVDAVTLARGSAAYLHWHRGPTHGPLGVVALGCISAAMAWGWHAAAARRDGREHTASAPLLLLCAIGVIGALVHVLMDLPTSYGTRLFSPFDWHWFAVDWMPIVDVYLLAVLALGFAFGGTDPATRRRSAAIVLVLIGVNYGVRAASHQRAMAVAPRVFGARLPAACGPGAPFAPAVETWPRASLATTSDSPGRRCLVELAAMPTFFSPFKWRLIARLSNAYELQDIDLLDPKLRAEAIWRVTLRPNVWTPPTFAAAATPIAQVFLGFSRFPDARAVVERGGGAVVRFSDIRFAGGLISLNQPIVRTEPFTLTVDLDTDGRVRAETLGR